MTEIIKARYRLRSGTTAEWAANDEVLGPGEVGEEVTTTGRRLRKTGNGTDTWSALPYRINATIDESVAPADGQVLVYDDATKLLKWANQSGGGGAGTVTDVIAGANIAIDKSNPAQPVVSSTLGAVALKGRKETYAGLPSSGNTAGDAYALDADNMIYVWNGSAWPAAGNGLTFGTRGVTLLKCPFTGANGATVITDTRNGTWTNVGAPAISTAQSPYGGGDGSLYLNGASRLTAPWPWAVDMAQQYWTLEGWVWVDPGVASNGYDTCNILARDNTQGNRDFVLGMQPSTKKFYFSPINASAMAVAFSAASAYSTWAFVSFSRIDNVLRPFLDGVAGTDVPFNVYLSWTGQSNNNLSFGNFVNDSPSNTRFKGYLRDWRFVTGQLARTGNFTPPTSPMT